MTNEILIAHIQMGDTGEQLVRISIKSGSRTLSGFATADQARGIARSIVEIAGCCDANNARADSVAAQLLEKFQRGEDEA